MRENKFQKALIDQLYSQGSWLFNVHGHKMQKSGVADILVVHRRWAGFLELKVEDNKASNKQKNVAKDLIKRYFPTFIVRYREQSYNKYTKLKKYDPAAGLELSIENFQGDVLCRPADLDKVLDCLQSLTSSSGLGKDGVPWVKMPKLFADDVRTCKAGDVIYFGKKKFVCAEEDLFRSV